MTVRHCIDKLVKAGKVSPKIGRDALALYEGMQGRLSSGMPTGSAEAHAALETARILAETAREKKLSVAKLLIAQQRTEERIAAHPNGRAAGLMAEMTADIHEKAQGANIESLTEVIANRMMGMFREGAEALRTGWKMVRDKAMEERVLLEMFGVDTANATAKAAAAGFRKANDWAVMRAKAAGKVFSQLDEWRIPQFWVASRVARMGEAKWTAEIMRHIDSGALRVMDKNTGAIADPTKIPLIVKSAFDNITRGGDAIKGAFNNEMRIFRFADGEAGAKAWLSLQGQLGTGVNLYDTMTGHIQKAAREIAFMDQWGVDYAATFRQQADKVRHGERLGKKAPVLLRMFESATAAERTFDVMTGKASEVASETMAGIFGGIRSGLAAAQLGSAIIPSVPGDAMTTALAANHNGIPAARVLARALKLIVDSPEKRAALARLNVTAYAIIDQALGQTRYIDDALLSGQGKAARFQQLASQAASFVIRAQGLQAWTEMLKRAFSMEMLALVAEQSPRKFNALDPPFRNFLTSRGITPAEWEVLRHSPSLEVEGARFFDIDGVEDRALGEKLMAGIVDERRYAVLEPTARIQGFATRGLRRGSFEGELFRSVFAYKSFPMMMMVMHGARAWLKSPAQRASYIATIAIGSTIAGAATIQAKSLLLGKDPRPMNTGEFWMASLMQGGALGIFGDFLYQGYTRGGTGLAATLAGPVFGGLTEQAGRLAFPAIRDAYEGEPAEIGAELARTIRWNMPGTNLWYARLALDRLLWDQVQTMVDPDYHTSFRRQERRMKQAFGQAYWWRPGERTPGRPPNLGNVAP